MKLSANTSLTGGGAFALGDAPGSRLRLRLTWPAGSSYSSDDSLNAASASASASANASA